MLLSSKCSQFQASRFLTFETSHNPHHQLLHKTQKLLLYLQQCVSAKQIQQIHTQFLIRSIYKPNFLLRKIIHLQDFNYANLFFSHIPSPNEYGFNIMIRGLATTWQRFDFALQSFCKMKSLGLKPDNFTYPFVFISCGSLPAAQLGKSTHCEVVKNGLCLDFHVRHSVITMYSRFGKLGYARKVFDEMTERDLVSWNSMISGYSQMGYVREAVELFGEMRNQGVEPNEMTLVSVLGACGGLGDLNLGRCVESYVLEKNFELNSFIGSALINMYGKCGDLASAKRIFDGLRKKDVIIWNAMISGFAQNGFSDETISLFNTMKEEGVNPNKITLVVVLSACASIGALDIGKWIDEYASTRGLKHDIYVGTALIDMYAKCGSLDSAYQIFENMSMKNRVSWNAMISALAFHGRAFEALSLFDRMSAEGDVNLPDDITFVGVLSACVHAGLVDEGYQIFSLMKSHGLVPKIEHYSCMVDLLSRAGCVEEAWDLIEKMPEKPDEVLLGAVLGACRKVKNVEIAERVMQLILQMEPSNSGNYIISSKIYAHEKRWDESARMLRLMKEKGVTKTPGCSWIEMDSQVFEFHAGDSLNQNTTEIYEVLKLLYEEIKIEADTLTADFA
nr:pentatricopeptide repeat-containing protein At2g34400 [Ipomoea batatas]